MNRQDSLAAIVRRERRVHGWTQDQLARAAVVNLRTVQRVERGSACSGETLQALASALNLSTPKLTKAAPGTQQRSRVLGLSRLRSMRIGAVLCLPALIFVVLNIGYYELGLAVLEPLVTSTAWNSMVDNRFALLLILGGPAIALLLNMPYLVQIRASTNQSTTTVSGLIFRRSLGQWLVIGLAIILFATITIYGAIENVQHMIRNLWANS